MPFKLPMRRDYEPGTYYPKDSQSADIMSKTFPERPGVPKISGDRVPSLNPKSLTQGPCATYSPAQLSGSLPISGIDPAIPRHSPHLPTNLPAWSRLAARLHGLRVKSQWSHAKQATRVLYSIRHFSCSTTQRVIRILEQL